MAALHAGPLSLLVQWPVDPPFGHAFGLAFFLATLQLAAPAQESGLVLMPCVPALCSTQSRMFVCMERSASQIYLWYF